LPIKHLQSRVARLPQRGRRGPDAKTTATRPATGPGGYRHSDKALDRPRPAVSSLRPAVHPRFVRVLTTSGTPVRDASPCVKSPCADRPLTGPTKSRLDIGPDGNVRRPPPFSPFLASQGRFRPHDFVRTLTISPSFVPLSLCPFVPCRPIFDTLEHIEPAACKSKTRQKRAKNRKKTQKDEKNRKNTTCLALPILTFEAQIAVSGPKTQVRLRKTPILPGSAKPRFPRVYNRRNGISPQTPPLSRRQPCPLAESL